MQLLQPPPVLVLLFLNHLCLATLTHVLIYIFVNIYLHICIIVHICYGIYLHFCVCANICKFCRVAERLEDVARHIWASLLISMWNASSWYMKGNLSKTNINFGFPRHILGLFPKRLLKTLLIYLDIKFWSLSLFWKKVQFWPLSSENGIPRRIAWVALAMWPQQSTHMTHITP